MIGCRVLILHPHPSHGIKGVIVQKARQMVVVRLDGPHKYADKKTVHVFVGYIEILDSAVDALGGLVEPEA